MHDFILRTRWNHSRLWGFRTVLEAHEHGYLGAKSFLVKFECFLAPAIEEQIDFDFHDIPPTDLINDWFYRLFPFANCSAWARMRSSWALSSGVNSAPKSSASNIWRISTSASSLWGLGQRFNHPIASSIDLHCQIQNPASNSFVSANGPSITVRLLPENLTRTPLELGCNPSPASITPAFASSSLNLPISVRSCLLGITPASESLLALIKTMNRIVFPPFFDFQAGLAEPA